MSFIEKMQLSVEERKVYELLLGLGNLTAPEIANFTHINYNSVESALQSLKSKGAVGQSEGYLIKYFARIPLDYLGQKSDDLANSLTTHIQKTSTVLKEKKDKFDSTHDKLTQELEHSFNQKKEEINQVSSQNSENLKHNAQKDSEEIKRITDKTLTDITTKQKEFSTELSKSLVDHVENEKNSINQSKTVFNTTNENSLSFIDEKVTEFNSLLTSKQEEHKTKAEQMANDVPNKIQPVSQTFLTELDQIQSIFNERMDGSKLNLNKFHEEQTTATVKYTEENTKASVDTTNKLSQNLSQSLTEFDSTINQIFSTKVENLSAQLNETILALQQKVEEIKQSVLTEFEQSKSGAFNSISSQLKETIETTLSTFDQNKVKYTTDLISNKEIFTKKLDEYHTETITNYQQLLNQIEEETKTRFDKVNEEIILAYKDLTNVFKSNVDEQKTAFTELLEQMKTTLGGNIEDTNKTVLANLETMTNYFDKLLDESKTKIDGNYQSVTNSLQENVSQLSEQVNLHLQKSLQSQLSFINVTTQQTQEELTKGKQLLAGNLTNEVEETKSFALGMENVLVDSAKDLMGVTLKLKEEFQTLEGTTKLRTALNISTTSIIGLDAVLSHIERIVKNTKRGVTILSPKLDYIPLDIIKTLPRTAQVTIVSHIDEEKHKSWIQRATSVDANVVLRTLRESGSTTGVEAPNFIGVERENEEVLIAAEDETSKEVVGILSSSTHFAKVASYIIIADYARGRSTQIKVV